MCLGLFNAQCSTCYCNLRQKKTFHETSHLLGSDGSINAVEMGENLAWGYNDPFDGWYRKEKNGTTKGIVKTIAIKF